MSLENKKLSSSSGYSLGEPVRHERRRGSATPRRLRPQAVGAVLALALIVVSVVSGTVQSTDITLVYMGFDPDRAQLITSLVLGGIAGAVAALVLPNVRYGMLVGGAGVALLYTQTFLDETANALGASGPTGSFSASGWVITLVTLLTIGAIAAAAGAALAVVLRPLLILTGQDVRDLVRARPRRPHVGRPAIALIVVALLAVTMPAFGDMVNLSPDALMLAGVDRVPLTGATPGPIAAATDTPMPTDIATAAPSSTSAATPTPAPTETPAPGPKPWLAWKPSGEGDYTSVNLPAPWTGGTRNIANVTVYTPPGYDPKGSRRYPVLYEAPTGLKLWDQGTGALQALDELIDTGAIPASIVVWIDEWGAPLPDTECADSTDGRIHMETFISKTVVDYLDSHYLTIARPAARGLMGLSTGGFCAAMVTLRHPDVFSSSISFSGYYQAGTANSNSGLPFGNQPAALKAHSPIDLLGGLVPAVRKTLYFLVIADPTQPYYGPQATSFDAALKADGYSYLGVASHYPHGWPEVRAGFPLAAEDWAARLVVNQVF